MTFGEIWRDLTLPQAIVLASMVLGFAVFMLSDIGDDIGTGIRRGLEAIADAMRDDEDAP